MSFNIKRYKVVIKAMKSFSSKSTTLYNANFSNDSAKKMLHFMLVEEKDRFLDRERRVDFIDRSNDSYCTHSLQIIEVSDNTQKCAGSFSFIEHQYSCEEMIGCINFWLKGEYKKENLEFPKGEVENILKKVK